MAGQETSPQERNPAKLIARGNRGPAKLRVRCEQRPSKVLVHGDSEFGLKSSCVGGEARPSISTAASEGRTELPFAEDP